VAGGEADVAPGLAEGGGRVGHRRRPAGEDLAHPDLAVGADDRGVEVGFMDAHGEEEVGLEVVGAGLGQEEGGDGAGRAEGRAAPRGFPEEGACQGGDADGLEVYSHLTSA
jgi:hypothetical protein